MATSPRTFYATSDGLSIGYQIIGDGPPDLVCVAGWLTQLDVAWENHGYRHFVTRLAGFSRLSLFDKRGVGLSDRLPPGTVPTLEERIEWFSRTEHPAPHRDPVLTSLERFSRRSVSLSETDHRQKPFPTVHVAA